MKPASEKPDFYRHLTHRHPEVFKALDSLGAAVRKAGPLDEKTVHLFQLAAAAAARRLAERGRRLTVVAKAMHARGVDRFLARLREGLGVHVVHVDGALAATGRALASGDVVVMPIDQVPDRRSHGIAVPFLGETALVDRAPATVAWRSRATVLVVAAERRGELHRVRVLGRIEPRRPGHRHVHGHRRIH